MAGLTVYAIVSIFISITQSIQIFLQSSDEDKYKKASIIDLFRHPTVRKITIIVCLHWKALNLKHPDHISPTTAMIYPNQIWVR